MCTKSLILWAILRLNYIWKQIFFSNDTNGFSNLGLMNNFDYYDPNSWFDRDAFVVIYPKLKD